MADPVKAVQNFFRAETFIDVVNTMRDIREVCGTAEHGLAAYEEIKAQTSGFFQCKQLWDLLDKKQASCTTYEKQDCKGLKVLVVGAGPAGLRTAIDLIMQGAEVLVVEKRPYLTRNNVLHLWKSTVQEGIELGMKFFYKKFCAGGMDHISIRRVQINLTKVFLILGGQLQLGVTFNDFIKPTGPGVGWSVDMSYDGDQEELRGAPVPDLDPDDFKFDVVVGADGEATHVGKVADFEYKTFQGPRALGITFNFKNANTVEELTLDEFGIIRYCKPQTFEAVANKSGIELETLTYYRDETHYYVMAATKDSMVKQGVFKENLAEIPDLLQKENIDQAKFEEAAQYIAEECGLPDGLDFAQNRYGEPDMGIFDFTKKKAVTHPCKILEHEGQRLMVAMVGDALIAPFWPQGTGGNRCFLGARDLAWMLAQYNLAGPATAPMDSILKIMQDHELTFRLLQESPDSLMNDLQLSKLPKDKKRGCDPSTRYLRYPGENAETNLHPQMRHRWSAWEGHRWASTSEAVEGNAKPRSKHKAAVRRRLNTTTMATDCFYHGGRGDMGSGGCFSLTSASTTAAIIRFALRDVRCLLRRLLSSCRVPAVQWCPLKKDFHQP
ncbi:hypothetical protein CYMTET_29049 [Cymbomonas tetramitiformis]|uniref:FAD-binding domain-containing protein n=1 Tax=Cymbomonas tetramitiformis TaxID=36881 RepID=A0AAE0FLV7_9CHLO|nr:hypothetical protein CYMTET_29049 [Cymbomonas tetramitiformis]